jgi:hypothetical protein
VTSIQNTSDRKRVEAITISRQTRSKMPPTGLGAQCGARHNKTAPQSPADDTPPVQLHAPLLHAPSAHASGAPLGSCALLIEPTVTTMARSSGPAAPPRHPTAIHKAFIAALRQVIRTNSTQTETSYDDLRRACRRRDPGGIDPLRHVFEDAMSDVLPLRRTRFLTRGAGRLTSRNHRPVGLSPRTKNLIIINRRIQLITECNMHGIFIFARSPQLEIYGFGMLKEVPCRPPQN